MFDEIDEYKNILQSFDTMFVMLTTNNFPDAMLKTFPIYSKFTIIFFLSYMFITYIVLIALLKALYYSNYIDIDKEKIIDFLEIIPEGYYVMIMTFQETGFSYDPEEWAADDVVLGNNIFDMLEAEGATQIRDTETLGSRPYILWYKKGEGVIEELMAPDLEETIISQLGIPLC